MKVVALNLTLAALVLLLPIQSVKAANLEFTVADIKYAALFDSEVAEIIDKFFAKDLALGRKYLYGKQKSREESVKKLVAAMRKLDKRGLPSDFVSLYEKHIDAWEKSGNGETSAEISSTYRDLVESGKSYGAKYNY